MSNTLVLIENQLEKTDHSHLGQVLTYAAGLKAQTVIWIASKFTDEHRAAMDWLNTITQDEWQFFGLEIELWRIGASPPAPKFSIICKPNEWSRAVRDEAAKAEASSPTQALQLRFWSGFRDHMVAKGQRAPKPSAQSPCVRLVVASDFPRVIRSASDISCTENLIPITPPNSRSRHCSKPAIAARVQF
ncbi:hypothetical protein ABLV49_23785 (plasmid) [Polaromonas hydrogenivorans]|uniref:DUF4276 family protein n=1 Tax=Polaromonas hydrogenivorans TaxID=335476 RepID=A0AAU7LYU9_9BURK